MQNSLDILILMYLILQRVYIYKRRTIQRAKLIYFPMELIKTKPKLLNMAFISFMLMAIVCPTFPSCQARRHQCFLFHKSVFFFFELYY
jgi:hypothetical protein